MCGTGASWVEPPGPVCADAGTPDWSTVAELFPVEPFARPGLSSAACTANAIASATPAPAITFVAVDTRLIAESRAFGVFTTSDGTGLTMRMF